MDIKKLCIESIKHCEGEIITERLAGNIVKKAHYVGAKTAYQTVISALLGSEKGKRPTVFKEVRDNIEVECGDTLFRIRIKEEGCKQGLDIVKIENGDGHSSMLIEPHVCNNVTIF